jgi:AraC-like DNA-binding protein
MYEQISEQTLYLMFYAVVAAMSMIACCYLLFRRGNAFAPDITSPVRLRQWTAAFFAAITLCHLWYLPTYFLSSISDMAQGYRIAALLDCMTVIPLTFVVLLTMLQDRQRQLWPVCVAVAPLVVGLAWCVATRSDSLLPVLYVYFLLMWLGVIIYMVCAIRQYGRWLRDNYADLEHKEVWQNFLVLGIFLLAYVFYSLDEGGLIFEYAMEVTDVIVVGYLLWRVETLSDLSIPVNDEEEKTVTTENVEDNKLPLSIRNSIESLLQQHCIDNQLYLQHDLNLLQLAKAIGTNRSYLSQYFSSIGMNYNAYINDLRINHFVSLYHEAVVSQRSINAKQLALKSGYRSYNTFREAFKRKTEQSVTVWIKEDRAMREAK